VLQTDVWPLMLIAFVIRIESKLMSISYFFLVIRFEGRKCWR
jgi:hypothetical protein